jgi:FtsP/CotA-like multicopper oxidase with cupredoxin domain
MYPTNVRRVPMISFAILALASGIFPCLGQSVAPFPSSRTITAVATSAVATPGITNSPADAHRAAIRANDNRIPAGKLENGVLTLHLELTSGDWYPEADGGPSMKVDALAEEGKAPQIPGPLLRVPEGTEIHASFHNLLPATAVIYGMHQRPGDAKDVIQVPPGETRELRFLAGQGGTYQYFASAGGEMRNGRPFRDDSQLHGAFIVDRPGTVTNDRVFVIGAWRSETAPIVSNDVLVINGKSWPHTERLNYSMGEEVRWRWINASDVNHPMHMHGSYYRMDSSGDGERDQIFSPEEQRTGVTHILAPGSTMATFWAAVPGRWVFHCHFVAHISPTSTVANAYAGTPELAHQHGPNHMGGLVLGITVSGDRPQVVTHGRVRKLRLLVRERPAVNGVPAGFGYQLMESHHHFPNEASAPGPPIILERGRPVEITVVNQLHEATAVHWHGMELESYYDGVVGWGARGADLTPTIEPGKSFCVRFTPPRAGTFIYHTHFDDELQLGRGLYGPLIVLDPGEKFDPSTDQIFIVSARGGRRSGDPKIPLTLLINGSAEPPTMRWRAGQPYRIRLIDITNAILGSLTFGGQEGLVQWRAHSKDGADLPPAQAVVKDAKLTLGPGETYDFEFRPRDPENLTLEFKANALPIKISQQITIE